MEQKVFPSRLADKIMLRLPDGMRDELKMRAARNRRSMNSEVIFHLANALGSQGAATTGSSLATSPVVAFEHAALAGGVPSTKAE